MVVTTIIPTYNRPMPLQRAVASVLAQTVTAWELLVIGDGTDDASAADMANLAERDDRVRFWNLPRPDYPDDPLARWRIAGLAAVNFGIAHAVGDWISILADDDEYRPRHHAHLLDRSTNADLVFGITLRTDTATLHSTFGPSGIPQGCYIMRRSLAPVVAPEDCADTAWDGVWWQRFASRRIRHVDELVHFYHAEPSAVGFHG